MSMRALDLLNNLGDKLEPWNTGVTIAETDCFINITNQRAVHEPGSRVLLLNFSNMKIGKVEQLSTAGNREPCHPGDWRMAQIRLLSALRGGVGVNLIHSVSETDDPFIIRVEVESKLASEVSLAIGKYLEQFGLDSGIVHDH